MHGFGNQYICNVIHGFFLFHLTFHIIHLKVIIFNAYRKQVLEE